MCWGCDVSDCTPEHDVSWSGWDVSVSKGITVISTGGKNHRVVGLGRDLWRSLKDKPSAQSKVN